MRLPNRRIHHFRRQRGVVLFISLIMLVAMTLAGIALVRSVDTTNLIAGNLAFKQGATLSADAAIETARTWLITQTNVTLWNDNPDNALTGPSKAYYSFTPTTTPGVEKPWDQAAPTGYDWTGAAIALAADAAGNQVSYVIQRLCKLSNVAPDAAGNSCISTAGVGSTQGSSKGAGRENIAGALQYYYRVTSRVTGPRNTVSYVQSIIQI
jgi:type IV pilus assembly protein PilX